MVTKPEFNPNLGGIFNHNIEMLRDVAQTLGFGKMVNAYDNLSFGINKNNHIVVMIKGTDDIGDRKYICVEYEGDGMCHIEPVDYSGNVLDDRHDFNKLFDSHGYNKPTIEEAFRTHLRNHFNFRF